MTVSGRKGVCVCVLDVQGWRVLTDWLWCCVVVIVVDAVVICLVKVRIDAGGKRGLVTVVLLIF